jgi:hypothetical protein
MPIYSSEANVLPASCRQKLSRAKRRNQAPPAASLAPRPSALHIIKSGYDDFSVASWTVCGYFFPNEIFARDEVKRRTDFPPGDLFWQSL